MTSVYIPNVHPRSANMTNMQSFVCQATMKLKNAYIIGWIDNGYVDKINSPFGYQHRSVGDVSYISLVMFM